ncbi:MAG TPA: hypothetical protein VGK43_02595, partial [Solirubrobacterales bacterium]
MVGSRSGRARGFALGILLALSVMLLAAAEADAGRYQVAQCGWGAGADAGWADTTGGAKFRPDAFCGTPGEHVKSFTRDGQGTVSGTRFARWLWTPPPGTGIFGVRGTWWHALHDGMEQRLGAVNWGGGFEPLLQASATDTAARQFSLDFPIGASGFEERLLCARAESKWCSLQSGSWSALRSLTITVDDPGAPGVGILGGDLVAGGWRRGNQAVQVTASDGGAGIRFGETKLDGARVGLTEYPCEKGLIDGEWRATRMRPCLTTVSATHPVSTQSFSDGPHSLVHCATDFAANYSCTAARTVRIDNNAPAHPKAVVIAGGDGWRRVNDFDLGWENPGQGPASPISGAPWRIVGPAGYDTGVRFAAGTDRRVLANLSVPAAGPYSLQLWLRDEAGNEDPGTAVTVPLRFDDLRPEVRFSNDPPEGQVKAEVDDPHSGPAGGQILYRRVDADAWTELPTRLVPGDRPGFSHLVAPMPELGFGTFVFRADAGDGAGNVASTNLRADGTQMAIRRVPPPHVPKPPKAKSRLFARLRAGHGPGESLTVPFGKPALLSGRLARAVDGAGLGGRKLRIVSRPSRGALIPTAVDTVATGEQGGFELWLAPGPSRRVTVTFPGDGGLEPASRRPLELRVRAGVTLRAEPRRLLTGQAVRLSGRVKSKGAPIPRRGKLVAIQYLEEATNR